MGDGMVGCDFSCDFKSLTVSISIFTWPSRVSILLPYSWTVISSRSGSIH